MLALAGAVAAVGLVDSLNPATIAPGLLLATRGARRVAEFAAAFFCVNLAGGLALALGPGRLAAEAMPSPGAGLVHLGELGLGIGLAAAALAAWLARERLRERAPALRRPVARRGAGALGAAIAAAELPTAFPYFAVISLAAASGAGIAAQAGLLALFNLAFLAPLLALLAVLAAAGERGEAALLRARSALARRGHAILVALLAAASAALIAAGAIGLAA